MKNKIESIPAKYAHEINHPTHFYEGVPSDPTVNLMHIMAQRRRE